MALSFNVLNGHFYENISDQNRNWFDARSDAATKSFKGLVGHLETITSQTEQDFTNDVISTRRGWIGASDEEGIVSGATEGEWFWVDGPEAGTQFWTGGLTGMPFSGQFANWFSGEPNNLGGLEDYGEIFGGLFGSPPGTWNDESGSTNTESYYLELSQTAVENEIIGAGEEIRGTGQNDLIRGTDGENEIEGKGGDDTIFGKGGEDEIKAGGGNDWVDGGSGNDEIEGGGGHDILLGGAGNDEIEGGGGMDFLFGGDGSNELEGNGGRDTFVFAAGGFAEVDDFSVGQGDLIGLATSFVDGQFVELSLGGNVTKVFDGEDTNFFFDGNVIGTVEDVNVPNGAVIQV